MKTLGYTIRFNTPAFLGNAEQHGQWRTPPFKALIRQWWRVAYAAEHRFNVNVAAMRREEGLLFGNAWLSHREGNREVTDHCKSLVRIRLGQQDDGNTWMVGTQQGVHPLSNGLDTSYAWFGLIKRGSGQPDRTAIKAGNDKLAIGEASRQLHLAMPDELVQKIEEIMRLINTFGLLGSRSRGGWGSFQVDGIDPMHDEEIDRYASPLENCLKQDWAMALARNGAGTPCIWKSNAFFDTWDKAMRFVAIERKQVRTALKGVNGKDLRLALGFATPGRMPSPLRWKIIPQQNGKLILRVFAMPHKLPEASGKSLPDADLNKAWQIVCKTLDDSRVLARGNQ